MAGDDLRTRIVVMFDQEPKLSTLLLDNPHRLVVDLPETRFGFDEKVSKPEDWYPVFVTGWWGRGVHASS